MAISMGSTQRNIGDIQLFAELAQSPTTVVCKGYQRSLDRFVLMKLLRPGVAHDAERVRRFEAEARLIARVQHPNIVAIYASGSEDGRPFIAAEFIDGYDLRDLIAQRPLPPELVLFIVLNVARGLRAAHAEGILHRDLKPSNILVSLDGQVKLTDFGMASLADEAAGPEVRGTPEYLAPELVRGDPPTEVSDLFSLGATFYEALAGRAAFSGNDTGALLDAVLNHDPLPRLERFTRVPPEVVAICGRLLRKNPAARYPDADALIAALEAFRKASGLTADAAALKAYLEAPEAYRSPPAITVPAEPERLAEVGPALPPRPSPSPRRRMHWGWGIVAGLMLVGALGGSLLFLDETGAPSPSAASIEEAAARLPEVDTSRFVGPPDTDADAGDPVSVPVQEAPEPESAAIILPPDALAVTRAFQQDTTAYAGSAAEPPEAENDSGPAVGLLAIHVQPWADVYVGEDSIGRTPFAPITLPAGTHRLVLAHPLFPRITREVTVRADEEARVNVSLWGYVGRLRIDAQPWAEVLVDDVVRDTTPVHDLIVAPGERVLTLRHRELGAWDTTLVIRRGETQQLRFNLYTRTRRR